MGRGYFTVAQIKAFVADSYGVSVADIDGPGKHRRFAEPRHVAMVLAYHLTSQSKALISVRFNKHPNTAGDAINAFHAGRERKLRDKVRRLTLELVRG